METIYFEKKGALNTEKTLNLAKIASKECNIKTIVISSTTGTSALQAIDIFAEDEYNLIIVQHHDGFRTIGNEFSEEIKKKILKKRPRNTFFHIGTHALSGVERSFRTAHDTILPVEMLAITLRRCFGDGTKVAMEMAIMVSDAGYIKEISSDIICIAGTGRGLDTAWIVKPAYSNNIFDLKMKILICKPKNF